MVRTQVLKHLLGAGKGKRGGSKGDVRGRTTARGEMEKGGCVRVIEGKEVRGYDQTEYFLPAGVGRTSRVLKGLMAIEFPKNEEISGGENESVLPSVGEE